MSQIKALYRLQKIDLELDAQRRRVREINSVLEQDGGLSEARAAAAALQDSLHKQEARSADLNLEIKSITSQTAQLNDRLYGGHVSNPKELQDMEGKIDELKRRRADRENALLEAMIAVDDLQAELARASERLGKLEADRAAEEETLNGEKNKLKHSIKKLKTDREAAVQGVSEANLQLYDTLRANKRGTAVAVLEGESCMSCGVRATGNVIQQVRHGDELVLCTSCGRLLIAL
jgi:uncharacterized protein